MSFLHKLNVPFTREDVFRDVETPRGRLLVFANAYDSGFSPCWPEGSRDLLNRIEQGAAAWEEPSGNPGSDLEHLLTSAAERFIEWGRPVEPDALEGDVPVCAITAALVENKSLSIRYVGSGALHQRRDGVLYRRLKTHTLGEQFKDQGHEVPDNLKTVLTKYYGMASKELSEETWNYEPGDVLVFAYPERAAELELTQEKFERLDSAFALKLEFALTEVL